MIYAQEKAGQKMHLVHKIDDKPLVYALCGRNCAEQGTWRLTSNVSFGENCRRCSRIAKTRGLELPTIGLVINIT